MESGSLVVTGMSGEPPPADAVLREAAQEAGYEIAGPR